MPTVVFSALLSSFFTVRILKGPWMRNPQYLAVTMVATSIAGMAADKFAPGLFDDFIAGNLIAFAAAALSIFAFDAVVRT
jgi:hypothetical protein